MELLSLNQLRSRCRAEGLAVRPSTMREDLVAMLEAAVKQEKAVELDLSPHSDRQIAIETEKEAAQSMEQSQPPPLPAGWRAVVSRSTGATFYYAPTTGESTWVAPTSPPKLSCAVVAGFSQAAVTPRIASASVAGTVDPREAAAVSIQKAHRGHMARERYFEELERELDRKEAEIRAAAELSTPKKEFPDSGAGGGPPRLPGGADIESTGSESEYEYESYSSDDGTYLHHDTDKPRATCTAFSNAASFVPAS